MTVLEGKDSPYAKRLGEYAGAAMTDLHRYRMALCAVELRSDATPEIKALVRTALRHYVKP